MEESTRSHATRNLLIALAFLAVVSVGCCGCIAASSIALLALGGMADANGLSGMQLNLQGWGDLAEPIGAERSVSETIVIGDGGHLVLDVPVGEVWIEGTDGEAVVASGRITARGLDRAAARDKLDRYRLDITRDGQTVRVTGDADVPTEHSGNNTPQVKLTIQVPRHTSLDLRAAVGDLHVEGIAADAEIRTEVARVALTDVLPARQVAVLTGVGAIEFDSALVDGASYEFRSDVGAIRIRVPRASRFEVDASSQMGAVKSDFAVAGKSSGFPVAQSVSGAVNGGGETTVKAESSLGAVSLETR